MTVSEGNMNTSTFVNNGMNKYFIHITSSITTNITCGTKQHRDVNVENLTFGAMWVENENSARPNLTLVDKKYLYVPGAYHEYMNEFVSDPKFVDYIDGLYTGVLNALDVAMSVCTGDFPGAVEKLIMDIADFMSPETPTIFKQAYLDYLYDLSYEEGEHCGLIAKCVFSAAPNAGFDSYSVERWDETVMYGCPGMTGTWYPNER